MPEAEEELVLLGILVRVGWWGQERGRHTAETLPETETLGRLESKA